SVAFAEGPDDFESVDELYDLLTDEPHAEQEEAAALPQGLSEEGICCGAGDGIKAYEDSPMPILRGMLEGCDKNLQPLIDSGAALNLINEALVPFLDPKR